MKVGSVFGEFVDAKGRSLVLRTPVWDDLDDLLRMINEAVEDRVDIYLDEMKTRDEEATWLGQNLAKIDETGQILAVVAVAEGRVVGTASLDRKQRCMDHVGELGVLVSRDYRNAGLGTKMLQLLIEQGRQMGLEVLVIRHFSGNDRAQHVYEKIGFVETGRVPDGVKRDGRYRDLVTMTMKLRGR